MARTNKYTSINFNDIYEKKLNPTSPKPSSSSSTPSPSPSTPPNHLLKTHLAAARTHHGNRMLVLTRPTPKPISIPQTHLSPPPTPPHDQTRPEPDSISLRPLGRTGSGPTVSGPVSPPPDPVPGQERQKESGFGAVSPKPDRFVPPHLRPGFAGREERLQTGVFRSRDLRSPGRYGEDRRPKSGGGHERMRSGGGGYADLVEMNRPGSSGWDSGLTLFALVMILVMIWHHMALGGAGLRLWLNSP